VLGILAAGFAVVIAAAAHKVGRRILGKESIARRFRKPLVPEVSEGATLPDTFPDGLPRQGFRWTPAGWNLRIEPGRLS
jgi:hypothetical protein